MTNEEKNKYQREWKKRNREKVRKYAREYRERMNERRRERNATDPEYREHKNEGQRRRYAADLKYREREASRKRRRRAEFPWMVHYTWAKQRCTNPSAESYKYYGARGVRFLLTKLEMEILYKRDHADQMKCPSIDRINPKGDYYFGNCRFLERSKNCSRRSSPNEMRSL